MDMTNNFMSILPVTTFILNNRQESSNDKDLNHSSAAAMSTVVYVRPSSTHLNNQHFYASDHHRDHQQSNLNDSEHCQICGDLASGWHCGAITCEACKKFFLRSVSTDDEKKKYKCQRNFSCSITKRSRTQCQYCRFQKCISVGMRPHELIRPKSEDLYKKLPCLVCGASASGIHFGAVTCEACKGFFRRSIKDNIPQRYHCDENNNCLINSTTKITCRACRLRKCIEVGMSMNASRIGRQSNLFKESIRRLHNDSKSMATITDSARIALMAKKRKIKTKNEIDNELSSNIKEFIDNVHNAYVMYLKDLPRCIPHETVWSTMTSQMINYIEALMNFCQKTIPGFDNMLEKYEVISSCINSVIMMTLYPGKTLMKYSFENTGTNWNYWHAESTLLMELNAHVPQLVGAENAFRLFESKFQDLRLDEKEFSLLLLMIITRTNLNVVNEDNKCWTKCQYECVQVFSEYTQTRRSNNNNELPFEFYDIVFFVSQIRSLNRRISESFVNLPWAYIRNLPSYFYRIYVSNISDVSSILNSNYNSLTLSPIKSSINSTNYYKNDLFSNSLNSISSNNETTTIKGSYPQTSWSISNMMTNHYSYSSSNLERFDSQTKSTLTDDVTVSIRW